MRYIIPEAETFVSENTIMPYPMVHLTVAYDYLKRGARVSDAGSYLLGAVSPDAVHYRTGVEYTSDMKRDSHLCPPDEKWGYVMKNSEWTRRILDYLSANGGSDFILGYAVHLLTDLQNNVSIWTPFRMSLGGEFDKETYKLYGDECRDYDYELYCANEDTPEIFRLLAESRPEGAPGLVSASEVSALRDAVLYKKFAGKTRADISRHKYATRAVMEGFVTDSLSFVQNTLKGS